MLANSARRLAWPGSAEADSAGADSVAAERAGTGSAVTGCPAAGRAGAGWLDRRAEELATRSPLGAGRTPRSDTDVSAGPGPASDGPCAGPSLVSPAYQDAKLENFEGLPGGRPCTARQYRPYLSEATGESTVTRCSRTKPAMPGTIGAQGAQEVDTPEGRPVSVAEVELRVRALPQQETAKALLA